MCGAVFVLGCSSHSTSSTSATTGTIAQTSLSTATCGTCGDVNGDGNVDSIDSDIVQDISAGLRAASHCETAAADVNGDGAVTIIDALMIADSRLHSQFSCRIQVHTHSILSRRIPTVSTGAGVAISSHSVTATRSSGAGIGPFTLPAGGGIVASPTSATAPDPNQACQDLWLEEPFVSGSLPDNQLQIRDDQGNVLGSYRISNLDYFHHASSGVGYFELDSFLGPLIIIRNWTGGIFDGTAQKAVFQSFPHLPFEVPRGDNAFYSASSLVDIRSNNAPKMSELSVVCGYDEIGIGKLYWVNTDGDTRIGYYLKAWIDVIARP